MGTDLRHPQATPAITTLLFDLGNTLIYFDGNWQEVMLRAVEALYQTLLQHNLNLPTDGFQESFWEALNSYYIQREHELKETTTINLLIEQLGRYGFSDPEPELLQSAIGSLYAVTQQHWQPEKDAQPVLKQLAEKGFRMALISNASDDQDVQTLVDKAGIRPYFEIVLSSAAAGIRKPDPEIFWQVLHRMGIKPEMAAMIGDTLNADILGAQRAGILDIWIYRRVTDAQTLQQQTAIKPSFEIQTLAALPGLLEKITKA
ncbi:MAG: HAD family hydrolase [Anaerolineales bacterium]